MLYSSFAVLSLLSASMLLALMNVDTDETFPKGTLADALVVRAEAGEAVLHAVPVSEQKDLRRLEAFFANYRKRPVSEKAGSWDASYYIYFNFPKGVSLRLMVGSDDGRVVWSSGQGDFPVKGDFEKFIKELMVRTSEAAERKSE